MWPDVRDTCANLGWTFDRWQDGIGRLIFAVGDDGLYAARDGVALSIPRQTGKTYLIGAAMFALCLGTPGLTVIWTAHRVKTAKETFNSMAGMAKKPTVQPHIDSVMRGRGDEAINFVNDARVLFGARESGFGRGFAGVDVMVFDEAQILTDVALDDMLAAQNVTPNALTFYTGTPPRPRDPGEVFTRIRDEALSGDADGTLYVEMSADRTADPDDREQWRKANVSYPHRTTDRAMLRLRKRLTLESWFREALGIWDETAHKPVVSRPFWDDLQARGVLPDVPAQAVAIDRDPDGPLRVGACWSDGDDSHVELMPVPNDEALAVELLAARCGRRIPVLVSASSPARSLVPGLRARHVKVELIAGPDMSTAFGLFHSDLTGQRLTHAGQKPLTDGLMAGRTKTYGDAGARVWAFGTPGLSAVIVATLARFGASKTKPRKSTASGGRRATVL